MKWWESSQRVEAETAWFRAGGYPFTLDQAALDDDGVVIFRGELRKGSETCRATVVYPAAYDAGQHPIVIAPNLPISRHKGPDGVLCLDHPSPEDEVRPPMTGAEAVRLAEELWRISIDDPQALRDLEADAPDPRIEHYRYEPASAVVLLDPDVDGEPEGYFRLGLSNLRPLRGALAGLGHGIVDCRDVPIAEANSRFTGPLQAIGLWRRVDSPPPGPDCADLHRWAQEQHGDLLGKAQALSTVQRQVVRHRGLPTLVGFVFLDEGPARDEFHDEWILLALSPTDEPALARAYSIRSADRWVRQPQLAPLGDKRVGVVGSGALGSQVGGLLSRAGVDDLCGIDNDILAPGNRVRHESDLSDLGLAKVQAFVNRAVRVNPFVTVSGHGVRLGGANADPVAHRRAEQVALADLASRDLVVNATANITTGYFLSAWANQEKIPILHVAVSSGAWSGRILLQRPGRSGCLECMARHQAKQGDFVDVPVWDEDPEFPQALDLGCGQASFAGPGFELTETAAAATRVAVQALLDGDGYPAADFDLVTLRFRNATSALPEATYSKLPRHALCESCSA